MIICKDSYVHLFQYRKCPFLSMERPWMKSVYDTFPANCVENLLCTRSGIGAIIEGGICRRMEYCQLSSEWVQACQLQTAVRTAVAGNKICNGLLYAGIPKFKIQNAFCWQYIMFSWFWFITLPLKHSIFYCIFTLIVSYSM